MFIIKPAWTTKQILVEHINHQLINSIFYKVFFFFPLLINLLVNYDAKLVVLTPGRQSSKLRQDPQSLAAEPCHKSCTQPHRLPSSTLNGASFRHVISGPKSLHPAKPTPHSTLTSSIDKITTPNISFLENNFFFV